MDKKNVIDNMYYALPSINRNSLYGILPHFRKIPITILGKVKYEKEIEEIINDRTFKKCFHCLYYPRKQEGKSFSVIVHETYEAIKNSELVFLIFNGEERIGEGVTHELEFADQVGVKTMYYPIV